MSINRYDARSDYNQAPIKKALERVGCKVYILKRPLDLLVSGGRLGDFNLLMEVKMPDGTLTIEQKLFIQGWPGRYVIVTTAEEALEAVLGRELLR